MNNLIFFIALIFILWIGRSIFIPLLFATFLWYLLNAIAAYYRKILPCYRTTTDACKIPTKLYNFVSGLFSFATVGGIIYLFATQIKPMLIELYNHKHLSYCTSTNNYTNKRYKNQMLRKIENNCYFMIKCL